jgi:hypothetical protein
MTELTRELFLQPAKIPKEVVPLPELGNEVTVVVVGMTAAQRADFELSLQQKNGKPSRARQREIRERLVIACCRDSNDNPIFTHDDIGAISQQSAALVERIALASMRVCGVSDNDIESLAGNSESSIADD